MAVTVTNTLRSDSCLHSRDHFDTFMTQIAQVSAWCRKQKSNWLHIIKIKVKMSTYTFIHLTHRVLI